MGGKKIEVKFEFMSAVGYDSKKDDSVSIWDGYLRKAHANNSDLLAFHDSYRSVR